VVLSKRLTGGILVISIETQVVAGIFVESEITPASIPPAIPPTSKTVERSALSSAEYGVVTFM